MSNDNGKPAAEAPGLNDSARGPWYADMTRYHWLVLIFCTLGWTFDCFDQQLFALCRAPAMAELLGVAESDTRVVGYGTLATSLMLIGWATGGIFFGIWADKYGRVRIMCITLAFYACFTGLSGIAQNVSTFMIFRFLTGLGIGGQFAVCATLIAESLSNRSRPIALGTMQAFASIGNLSAALATFVIGQLILIGILWGSAWRWSFMLGFLPMILVYLNWRYLREPEVWKKSVAEAKADGRKTGSILELFGDRTICYRVIVGMLFAMVGVIGFWGIMLFAIDLNRTAFADQSVQWAVAGLKIELSPEEKEFMRQKKEITLRKDDSFKLDLTKWETWSTFIFPVANEAKKEEIANLQAALTPESVERIGNVQKLAGSKMGDIGALTSALINIGGFLGIFSFTYVTNIIGRRKAFTIFLTASMFSVMAVFMLVKDLTSLCIYVPMMGFAISSLMGGYTIYFPELFPTRLRSTAVSFCYNVGRYVAAVGPIIFGIIALFVAEMAGDTDPAWKLRMAGFLMSPIFLLGIALIWMLPETHGKPLPE